LTWIKRARRLAAENVSRMLDQEKLEHMSHLLAIRSFAHELGIHEETAAQAYLVALDELGAGARIKRYIGVLAERRTKDRLRQQARRALRR
jgi:DNA-binding transcriptional regulator YhcF (GntR family)